ncbi:MAG: hemerythrin domain-containing protein [Candidatus Obscuribacterales bacterium]|nr:hemerythrin domain-containing protein [Candidatus Obscuribacterales bacterium]
MPARAKKLDVTELLHADHQIVRELFFSFSKSEDKAEKDKLVKQILTELFIHAKVEEEIVYPLLENEGEEGQEIKGEAENEHRVVQFVMAEIVNMKSDDDELKAKITVLCELVEHHAKEEEKEMFKKLRDSGEDLEALAEEVAARKVELRKESLPAMKASLVIGDEVKTGDAKKNSVKGDKDTKHKTGKAVRGLQITKTRKKSA